MRGPHPYDPECPDCIPALIDVQTKKPFPREHPTMVKILQVWHAAPYIQRQAFMAVTKDRSKAKEDLANASPLLDAMARAMQTTSN